METNTITVFKGDGIGPEITDAVLAILDEAGADVSGMSDEELEEACEVFTLPSGGYLIVEG